MGIRLNTATLAVWPGGKWPVVMTLKTAFFNRLSFSRISSPGLWPWFPALLKIQRPICYFSNKLLFHLSNQHVCCLESRTLHTWFTTHAPIRHIPRVVSITGEEAGCDRKLSPGVLVILGKKITELFSFFPYKVAKWLLSNPSWRNAMWIKWNNVHSKGLCT